MLESLLSKAWHRVDVSLSDCLFHHFVCLCVCLSVCLLVGFFVSVAEEPEALAQKRFLR